MSDCIITEFNYINIIKFGLNQPYNHEDISELDISEIDFAKILLHSSKKGWLECIKLLIKEIKFDFVNINKALIIAISEGHIEIVKFFKENKLIILEDDNIFRMAHLSNQFEIIKYLVETPNNNLTYNTFLSACMNNNLKIVEYLFESGKFIKNDKDIKNAINYCNNNEIINYLNSKRQWWHRLIC